MNTISY